MGCDGTARASGCGMATAGEIGVVTICRFLALQALERLTEPGADSVNPMPGAATLSFLVPVHAAGCRPPLPGARGSAAVVLPPGGKEAPPGPQWLMERSRGLTFVAALCESLETVAQLCPERVAVPADLVGELRVLRHARNAPSVREGVLRGRGW
ncbi:hypothetical protein M2160_009484 [Streptomyces sp. SAI-117]|nr:hypothetical protein [Streptomyces sp. SAI-041]MDH6555104.1 hypothetical protein [Streptomyces sp. SAI-041]MDH6573398.1 hypothetical protein [Streptomyces sp. SAI-117]MDH6574377.1 hypothetical protein [Streptomyces sp. SAI-117]